MKWIAVFAFCIVMASCGSEQSPTKAPVGSMPEAPAITPELDAVAKEKAEEAIVEQIDAAIKIADQAGSFQLRIKGEKAEKNYSAKGNQGTYQATLTGNKVNGSMALADGKATIDFTFLNELGFQSLSSESVHVKAVIKDGSLKAESDITEGKISLNRAKSGDFAVGNITGFITIDKRLHSFYCSFQVPLK